ncbi:hypothetical protein GPECTOR_30g179 [Gonium pectorale]|uniref:SET domain-containing protein n=1 Tax=Gonium pectorale TaxID=33097 RepID=A0A150GE22_GONPE|nr:hypothetical protein GPECTOR_30g179 [Gonium pectorale]|eukprot:KXZ48084.1 hypothetical protein GPECTOR_30g179 [Gonium pectorale]
MDDAGRVVVELLPESDGEADLIKPSKGNKTTSKKCRAGAALAAAAAAMASVAPGPAVVVATPHGSPSGKKGNDPGQVRVCGLTFDAALAPAVASAQAAWLAGLGRELRYADPTRDQLALGLSGTAKQLSRAVVCNKLARLLGLEGDNGRPDVPLPEGPVLLESALQPCGDPARGGAGLQAAMAIKRNAALGVLGGYVMPAGTARDFMSYGHKQCRPEVAARLTVAVEGIRADMAMAWRLLAGAFRMPLPAGLRLREGSDNAGAPTSPFELSMLGYGNLTALVNDPRVNPRDWTPGNDVDSQEAADRANCTVVPVSVRGLVLPVLVALRDIAPGEQLLRDYGADWWHDLAAAWEVAEDAGVSLPHLLHGIQAPASGPDPQDGPSAPCSQDSAALERAASAVDAPATIGTRHPFHLSADQPPGQAPAIQERCHSAGDHSGDHSHAAAGRLSPPHGHPLAERSSRAVGAGGPGREAQATGRATDEPLSGAAGSEPHHRKRRRSLSRARDRSGAVGVGISMLHGEHSAAAPSAGGRPAAAVGGVACAASGLVAALGQALGLDEEVLRQLAKPLGFLRKAAVVAAQQLLQRYGLPYVQGAVLRVTCAPVPGLRLRLGHSREDRKDTPLLWADVRVKAEFGRLVANLAAADPGEKAEMTSWVYSLNTFAPSLELKLDPTSLGPAAAAGAAARLGHHYGSVVVPLYGQVNALYCEIQNRSVTSQLTGP